MIAASEEKRRQYRESGWWGDVTLATMFADNAARHPQRLAVVDAPNRAEFAFGEPKRLTYAGLKAEVDRIAAALVAADIGKDDLVLVQLPNITELVSLYFAVASIGAIISPLAVQYRHHELAGILEVARPKAFICATHMRGNDHLGVAQALIGPDTRLMTFGPDSPDGAIDLSSATGDAAALERHRAHTPIDADDIFTVCWTSGTTGAPKGVPRSHNHWSAIAPGTYQSANIADGEVMLNPFPMINMASIGGVTMAWLKHAGTMVLHHPFDLPTYLAQIATERPSFTIAPPAILNMLLQNEALLASTDLSSLRVIGSGSAPLAPSMVRGFQERLGIEVINMFGSNEGMTLVSGAGVVPDPDERATYFPCETPLIPPFPGTKAVNVACRLVQPEGDAAITGDGVVGELQIKGPTIFEGYFQAPDLTAAAFTPDGYFRTGDLFQIEGDGRFFRFVGRSKDLIIRGGQNIAPEEIDQLVSGHPLLAEACAFAVPDDVMGERIGLAYVSRSGEEVTLEAITAFLRECQIAVFKLPERLVRFDSLPRNVTNKVIRTEVRERALKILETNGN